MGIQIESGTGNGQLAGVSSTGNRFDTSSRSNSRIYYISRDDGDAFSIYSEDDDAAAGDFILYFKNDDTADKRFFVEDIVVASQNASTFKIHRVTGTASGTDITPSNLNFSSGKTARATAKGNGAVTGLTSSFVVEATRLAANTTFDLSVKDALCIGLGEAIAIEYDTGTTGDAEVTILGYYE